MIKDDRVVGTITIYRQEVRPFSEKQMELVTNFAAQAVIAIENTRLLNELRQRTDDLTESLEQQTATSDVLKVISSSPGELEPVFSAMLENATRICGAKFATLLRFEDGATKLVSRIGVPVELQEFFEREQRQPGPLNAISRLIATGRPVHIEDYRADPAYAEGDPHCVAGVDLGGICTLLVVPMFKDENLIGAIGIYRQEVRPFGDKQIALVQNFAAQAVIAIENTRLLSELRQRTDDLTESLEQQTATSEVLKVISSSPGELEPVFATMLDNATRICEAGFGILSLYNDGVFRNVAFHNVPAAYASPALSEPFRPHPGSGMAHVARTLELVHTEDLRLRPPYRQGDPSVVAIADLAGARTILNVPMLKDDRLVGVFSIFRQEVRPFTDKQIALVQNFAAQAVIAIENTRLLSELRESLEQQTATSEVLKVISSSPGDLAPVFEAMLENAVRICEANYGVLFRFEDGAWRATTMFGVPAAFAEFWQRGPQWPSPQTALGRVAATMQAVHIADVTQESAFIEGEPVFVAAVDLGRFAPS